MSDTDPILVTGAAGSVGSIGRNIVEILRQKNYPVRALVHRLDDRSQALADMGAEVVVADLSQGADVVRALAGCRRMYFGMSVSPLYLEATVIAAAAARQIPNFEILVNISQMTVSQMSLTDMTDSAQQRQHWLAEQVLNWSGLPVAHVRATVFLEHFFFFQWAAASIIKDGTIRLPFASGKTSPIAGYDVASVVATILSEPAAHVGKVYELTGAKSQDMKAIAKEYEEALGRPVKYVDVPFAQWLDEQLKDSGLPPHVASHFKTMAQLHADNRYDRLTDDVFQITGRAPTSIKDYVVKHAELFKQLESKRR
jgi:uncharacterized protein YbjT (DUF2867 family)